MADNSYRRGLLTVDSDTVLLRKHQISPNFFISWGIFDVYGDIKSYKRDDSSLVIFSTALPLEL